MKRSIIALSLFVAFGAANATQPRNECGNNGNNCNSGSGGSSAQAGAVGVGIAGAAASVRSTNRNTNVATGGRSTARATGGSATGGESTAYGFGGTGNGGSSNQTQSQGQTNSQTQGNTQSLGFSNSTTLNQTTVNPNDITVRNTGDAMGYAAPPSAVCAMTGGAGVAVPGFGGSVSGSMIDKGCEAREYARVLVNLGQQEAGIRVLCEASESVARNIKACADIDAANKARAASNKATDVRPTTDSMN